MLNESTNLNKGSKETDDYHKNIVISIDKPTFTPLDRRTSQFYIDPATINSKISSLDSDASDRVINNINDKIKDLTEISTKISNDLPALEYTESRLPSLGLLLNDHELADSIFNLQKNPFVYSLQQAICQKTDILQYENLQKFIWTIPSILVSNNVQENTINSLITLTINFFREKLSKCIECERIITSRSQDSFDSLSRSDSIEYPRANEIIILNYSLCMQSLIILRNLCTKNNFQESIIDQKIPECLLQRVDLFKSNIDKINSEFCNTLKKKIRLIALTVKNEFFSTILSFLGNVLAANNEAKEFYIRLMWPESYTKLAEICLSTNFDDFLYLVHNHFTLFIENLNECKDTDNKEIKLLNQDLDLMNLTYPQAKKMNCSKKLVSKFGMFYFMIIDYVYDNSLKNSDELVMINDKKNKMTASNREYGRDRLGTFIGRKLLESSKGKDWFNYFQLKLTCMKDGFSLYVLFSNLIDYIDNVSKERLVKRMSLILYSSKIHSKITDDITQKIKNFNFEHNTKDPMDKLGRKWNFIRRSFLNVNLFDILTDLTFECLSALAILESEKVENLQSFLKNLDIGDRYFNYTNINRNTPEIATLIRPIVKALLSIISSPELVDKLAPKKIILLTTGFIALLEDTSKYYAMITHSAKETKNFIDLYNYYNCTDCLLLITIILTTYPITKSCYNKTALKKLEVYKIPQKIDEDCTEAYELFEGKLSELNKD